MKRVCHFPCPVYIFNFQCAVRVKFRLRQLRTHIHQKLNASTIVRLIVDLFGTLMRIKDDPTHSASKTQGCLNIKTKTKKPRKSGCQYCVSSSKHR